MVYLVDTAHAQLAALPLGCVGWTLTGVALGLIQWRVWLVAGSEVIDSGMAWVGIWRACFNSHSQVSPGFLALHCRFISPLEAFTPPEIVAGQVLMLLSLLVGLLGNANGVYAMRNACLGVREEKTLLARVAFHTTGALFLLATIMSTIPLLWNLSSVATNQTIDFPADFLIPAAPQSQHVGSAIVIGLMGALLMIICGIIFCSYRLPARLHNRMQPTDRQGAPMSSKGKENAAFASDEHLYSVCL